MSTPSLFPAPPRRKGPTELAAVRVLARWRAAGHDVDALTSSLLRGAGRTVDDAVRDHADERCSALSVQRCRDSLLAAYTTLAPDRVEADVDELDELNVDLDELLRAAP